MWQVLLDAPDTPTKRVQIARLGPVSDSRYGDFKIDEKNVRNWQKNLSSLPGGRALIDQDHKRRPVSSSASFGGPSDRFSGCRLAVKTSCVNPPRAW
jgi:hypothetical protein